jgi:hypothetical protein
MGGWGAGILTAAESYLGIIPNDPDSTFML